MIKLTDPGEITPAQIESFTLSEVYIDKVFGLKPGPGKKDFTELWQNIKKKMVSNNPPGWYVQAFNDAVKSYFGRVTPSGGAVLSFNSRNNMAIGEITYTGKADGGFFAFIVWEIATGQKLDEIYISPDSRTVQSKAGHSYKQVPAMVNVQQPKIIVAELKQSLAPTDPNGAPVEPGAPAPGAQGLPWYIYAAGAYIIFKVLK